VVSSAVTTEAVESIVAKSQTTETILRIMLPVSYLNDGLKIVAKLLRYVQG